MHMLHPMRFRQKLSQPSVGRELPQLYLQNWRTDVMAYRRAGNAIMRAPPSGFSDPGLAQLFGIHIDEPHHSAKPTISKFIIIEGCVGGITGLALVIGALWFLTHHRGKKRTSIEEPIHEKDVHSDEKRESNRPAPNEIFELSEQ